MKTFFFTFLFSSFCFTLNILGQYNFKQSFIITLEGDTINGYVNSHKWHVNPSSIEFKFKDSDSIYIFKPLDIRSFHIGEKSYYGCIADIEVSPIVIDKLDYKNEFILEKDTTFLLSLVEGKKSLYFYRNRELLEYFYIKKNGDFELLKFKKYLKKVKQDYVYKDILLENKTYISQLSDYLNDCKTIFPESKDVSYNKTEIVKLFKQYYKCKK